MEFVKSNARKEKLTEKKNQGESELTDKEENRHPMKKPTLNISCIYRGQEVPEDKRAL